jgi:hypothetical protein
LQEIITDRGIEEIISGFDKTVSIGIEKVFSRYKELIKGDVEELKNISAIEQIKF